jgi:hypothetical protein
MSKYVTFEGIEALPEPPDCPECKGKCCRNFFGYRRIHMDWDVGEHVCEHCADGTVPKPVWTAEQERAAVVAWLRGLAADATSRVFVPLSRAKAYLAAADDIERGDHRKGEP